MHSAGAVSGRVRSAAAEPRPDSPGCTGLHRVAPGCTGLHRVAPRQDPTRIDHTVGEGKRGIPGRESRSLGGFTRLPCDVKLWKLLNAQCLFARSVARMWLVCDWGCPRGAAVCLGFSMLRWHRGSCRGATLEWRSMGTSARASRFVNVGPNRSPVQPERTGSTVVA